MGKVWTGRREFDMGEQGWPMNHPGKLRSVSEERLNSANVSAGLSLS